MSAGETPTPAVAQSLKCPICGQALNAWKCGCPEAPAVAQERPTPDTLQSVSGQEYRRVCRELAEANEKLSRLPADWSKDSSLETWFPYTAEELKGWRAIIKSQAEEIERLRGALEELSREVPIGKSMRHVVYGHDAQRVAQETLSATSGHLVAQIPQNMNDKPGCALDLSDNSGGPRLVRREVLE